MASESDYWGAVELWTRPSKDVKKVRIGRRDGLHHFIQDPTGRTPEQIDVMIENLRCDLGLDFDN